MVFHWRRPGSSHYHSSCARREPFPMARSRRGTHRASDSNDVAQGDTVSRLPPTMDDVFSTIAAGHELRPTEARELHERGFVVLRGPMSAANMERVSSAYDAIVASANADDVHTGSTTTRVADFVNR